MRSAGRPRGFRFVLAVVAVAFSLLLVWMAGGELVGGLLHPTYDSHENRAPGLVIGLAAAATIGGFLTLRIAVGRFRGGRGGPSAMAAWAILTALLIVATAVVSLASGPL